MNSLILDCSAGMYLCLLKDTEEFCCVDKDEKKHSDELLVKLDELLKEAGLNIRDIDNICVCIGPGSFTGVRVAISVCKGLAIGTGANVFALSNLDIYDCQNNQNSILVLGGFSEYVYARITQKNVVLDKCLSVEDLKKLILENDFEVFAMDEKVQNILKNYEIMTIIAENNIKNAFLEKIQAGDYIDTNKICPIYLRASQAEIERNKKLAGKRK